MLAVVGAPLVLGLVYTSEDLGTFHLPTRAFYARCLEQGDSFAWLPNLFCGFYLQGEGQAGMYHPLHLLLYRFLPLAAAFNLELLLSYPFAFAGTYWFLRRWELGRDAAAFGALVFAFSSFNVLHYMHINAVAVVAHIPWLLLAIDVVMRGGSRRRWIAMLGLALLTGSQLLLGHPQSVWLSLFAELLYIVMLMWGWLGIRRLLQIGGGKLLGVLIGAVQLLPTYDAATHCVRQDPSLAFGYEFSLDPANLLQLVQPYLFSRRIFPQVTGEGAVVGNPHELGLYNGAMASVLIFWVLARIRKPGPRRLLAIGALVLAAIALQFAWGEYGYPYRVQARIPLIGSFRAPCRYIVLVHLAMAVAAAIAFAEVAGLSAQRDKLPWRKLWPLAVLPLAGFAIAAFVLWPRAEAEATPEEYIFVSMSSARYILLGPVLVTLAAGLVAAALRGWRVALLGIVLFAAADQTAYGLAYVWRDVPTDYASYTRSVATPPDGGDVRLRAHGNADNVLMIRGYRLANGYAALMPKRQLDYDRVVCLRVAGVRWRPPAPSDSPGAIAYWVEVPDPTPRVRLVSRAQVSSDPNRDIDSVDIRTTALVAEPVDLPDGPPGEVVSFAERPGLIRVETHCSSRQLLVVSESYHDGWQASVDGEASRVVRVYGDFIGCVVEPGAHEVEFRFRPRSLRWGAWISVAGMVLAMAGIAFVVVRGARVHSG